VRSDRHPFWLGAALFLSTLLVYRIDCSCVGGGDAVGLRHLPLSLVREGDFDDFPDLIRHFRPAFLQVADHYYSVFPIGGAVLITPVYALPAGLGLDVWDDDTTRQWLVSWIASLLSAGSVAVVYATFASRGPRRAGWVALLYGLARQSAGVRGVRPAGAKSLRGPAAGAALLPRGGGIVALQRRDELVPMLLC
jgi:hypothetical protein